MYSHDPAALYAATESSGSTFTSGYHGIPVHPGEDASAKEETDWWRIFNGVIASTDAVHYAAGEEPPRLAHLKPADLTDYAELTVPAPSEASYMKVVTHNAMFVWQLQKMPDARRCAKTVSGNLPPRLPRL